MPPEQWSVLLHGDTQYESSIQSIIDELSTSTSFSEVIKEFSKVEYDPKNRSLHLFASKSHFESLSTTGIGYYNAEQDDTRWMLTTHLLRSPMSKITATGSRRKATEIAGSGSSIPTGKFSDFFQ
jgi:hypothetical protein